MESKRAAERKARAERRRHRRTVTVAGSRRSRVKIELSGALGELGWWLLEKLERLQARARIWRYRNRKVIS